MKLVSSSRTTDTSLVDRFTHLLNNTLVRLGFKRKRELTPRERYEAALDSSTITPEQRRKVFMNAATDPGLKAALDEADDAYEQHVKGLESGELHSRSVPPRFFRPLAPALYPNKNFSGKSVRSSLSIPTTSAPSSRRTSTPMVASSINIGMASSRWYSSIASIRRKKIGPPGKQATYALRGR